MFSEKGFERTRMEDVARAAGVGKGTLYEYFDTKESLMEGAIAALFADIAGDLMPTADVPRSAAETLVEMLDRGVSSVKQVGFAYRFFLEYMMLISRTDPSKSFIGEVLVQYRAYLVLLLRQGMESGEFRKDIDPIATAAALAAWLDGAVFHWYTLPDTVSLEEMGKSFVEVILAGLKPRCDSEE